MARAASAVTAVPVALTIAGSDSGGGAGIQADLKTFTTLGVFGTSAITCITAQNPCGVYGVTPMAPAAVTAQITAIQRGFPIAAAKTGMLYSAPIIRAVADAVRRHTIRRLVIDPVMIATSGSRLLRADAIRALEARLLPLALVITPNIPEAEALSGRTIRNLRDATDCAVLLARRYGTACLVKGGHLRGAIVRDILIDHDRITIFASPRVAARETHGTGCTLSAAIVAFLARGMPLASAIRHARIFVHRALATARPAGTHVPLNLLPPRRSYS